MKTKIFGLALVLSLATFLGACEGGGDTGTPGGATSSPATGEPSDTGATKTPASGTTTTTTPAATTSPAASPKKP
ncbi:hypothetical protein H6G41_05950 [Tolypothrix sp. FACHB-123]|uniref:hypothetical protein n=1 Tax=Tolypothrix sp. FACHB-123 TaxID=2692868 RepID=UPI001687CAF6|nr:hypothetical protein [Tolypothrix sp. FACHB-123]MBD2354170.1 hypothetical protein [Tolypothrix sp. FACHB-123]